MAEPKVLDADTFAAIIGPASAEQPAGPDLRNDEKLAGEFRAVRDARDAASKAEKDLWTFSHVGAENADKPEKPKPADWKKVLDAAVHVLSKQSKDLWVAAWMIEAFARQNGFRGLHDGFRVARELTERYWDTVHPRPEPGTEAQDDEVLETLVKLDLLDDVRPNVNLITQIEQISITEAKVNGRTLTSADYKEALQLEELTDNEKKNRRIEAGAVPLKDFQQAVEQTSPEFFLALIKDLEDCRQEFDLMHAAVRERCEGSRPPAADNIRAALDACLERVMGLAGTTIGTEDEAGAGDADGEGNAAGPVARGPGVAVGQIVSRDDAFKALTKVAEYFRKTEPHSPISYALEQAVRWGKMSLPELLKDLVPDDRTRAEMFLRTGIVPPENKDD